MSNGSPWDAPRKLDRPTGIRIQAPQEHLIDHILRHLSPRELDLMKRAYLLCSSTDKRRGDTSPRGALIAHALTVGLAQLSHALNPDHPYHLDLSTTLTPLLHDALLNSLNPDNAGATLDGVDALIRAEELRRREADKAPKPIKRPPKPN